MRSGGGSSPIIQRLRRSSSTSRCAASRSMPPRMRQARCSARAYTLAWPGGATGQSRAAAVVFRMGSILRPERRALKSRSSEISVERSLLRGYSACNRYSGWTMAGSVKTRTLQMAANALGGPRKLQAYLKVSSSDLAAWLDGSAEPSHDVFLRALEIILDELDGPRP